MATTNFRQKEREAAEKKARARKKKRRKIQLITAFVVILIISIITVCVLSLTVFFEIETITVVGSATYTAEEVISAAGIAVGDNLLLISKNDVNAKLQKALPFIDEAAVEKHFPGQLKITVKETKEELFLKNGNYCYSANFEGKILKKYSDYSDELILFTVSDKATFSEGEKVVFQNERETDLFYNFVNMINDNNFDVQFVNISDPFSSYMKFENRIIAKFGSSSYFENKIAYFKASLKGVSENAEGVFDLSGWTPENNKPVLTYGDISSYEK